MCKQPISYFSSVFHLVLCKVLQAALLIIFKATAESVVASSSYLCLQVDRLKRLLTHLKTLKTVHVTLCMGWGNSLEWKTEIDGGSHSKLCLLFKNFIRSESLLGQQQALLLLILVFCA